MMPGLRCKAMSRSKQECVGNMPLCPRLIQFRPDSPYRAFTHFVIPTVQLLCRREHRRLEVHDLLSCYSHQKRRLLEARSSSRPHNCSSLVGHSQYLVSAMEDADDIDHSTRAISRADRTHIDLPICLEARTTIPLRRQGQCISLCRHPRLGICLGRIPHWHVSEKSRHGGPVFRRLASITMANVCPQVLGRTFR